MGRFSVPHQRLRDAGGRFTQGNAGFYWVGIDVLAENINKRGKTLNASRRLTMEKLAGEMEEWARENAPWNDRTGDARAMLRTAVIHNDSTNTSTAWLAHGVPYGLFLEVGGFPIIIPTIMEFSSRMYSTVRELEDVQDIFDRGNLGGGGGEDW